MAESILFTIVAEIIVKLGSRPFQANTMWIGVKDELEKFKTTVSTIQAVLLDAEEQYSKSNQVRVWVDSLKEVFYDAEDLLDELSTEVLQQQTVTGNKMAKEVRRFFSSSNQVAFGLKMTHKIKAVRDRLDVIVANRKFHLEERRVEANHVIMSREREQTHSSPPEVIVGREEDKQAIIELLMASNYEENVVVIPIVGIGGLGKTTLAQLVYNDERVKTHFKSSSWVCVSDDFDVKIIVQKILESVTGDRCFSFEMDTLKNRLHETINGKRFLLVLDDIWCDNFETWCRLRDLLVGGARGSRIIITTRIKKVAEIVSTNQPYELEGLSDMDSWSLFKLMAFKQGKVPSPSFDAIGREIVGKYVGVPLAIRAIGRLLYFKNASEWLSFKNKELSNVDLKENDILSTLKLSYDHLPPRLRHCFAYCRIFPKGSKINVKKLVYLWMAQGYIKSSDPSQCLEDVGFEYFNDLLWRSFFQEVEKDHFGNINICRIHDLMHDLCWSVVGSGSNLSSSNVKYVSKGTRHVSIDYCKGAMLPSLLDVRKMRTFFLSNEPGYNGNKNQGLEIISNLRRVRALDAHNSGIVMVPRSLEKLKHIRFLDLSYNTRIETLPDSITKLQNLQVLKLAGLRRLKQLPKDIKKLVDLMHLDLWKCDGLTHMPPGLGQLTSLSYLSRFLVAKDDGVSKHVSGLGELCDLNNLRGLLEIMNLQNVKNPASEFRTANLKEKQHLQTLKLTWKSGDEDDNTASGSNDDVSLEELQPHENLQWLDVRGWGRLRFPSWVASLTSLVELRIDNCINCQNLPPLDQFPSLKHLTLDKLNDLKYIESGITYDRAESGPALFFPSLEKLWLRNCPNLKGWCRTDTSAPELFQFHCLAYFEIKSCPNLTSMPLIPTVERMVFQNTSIKSMKDMLKLKLLLPQSASSSCSSSSLSPSLVQLKELSIQKIEDLDFLPDELLQNLTSLQQLDIIDCPRITTLSHDMQHLTSLEVLIIRACKELDLSSEQWQCLRSLRKLRIVNLAKLVSLHQGLQHVTTLQQLEICSCPILGTLPEWISGLTTLRHLEINECPLLSQKCSNNKGEDWSKIAHIPNIKIDGRWIQLKGYYEL
ncbi:putative disease resistance protein RGA4 [Ricinus communis]|uniref:Disease resistance protein RGA2, putative n=1 Tax=Ricinus communis TaxID=3988 RepID=B9SL89_RICCO|nr:putative disease resistance protein RGA4 [Ricinus communis]EEF35612.1 Disease resistance protein RGA2, putative [Ricinus communis]|eukprot:XP_002526758.1 putative disease resistance protein RGA4 [Ricinus communis]